MMLPIIAIRCLLVGFCMNTLSVSALHGASYCALKVYVKTSEGKPVPSIEIPNLVVSVSWFNGDGKVEARLGIDSTTVFCDLPSRVIDITVRGPCGEIVAKRQPIHWLDTSEVYFYYPSCSRYHWVLESGCRLIIRVTRMASGVEGASVSHSDAVIDSSSGPNTSDEYGRIFKTLKYGSVYDVELSKTGYKSVRIIQNCTSFQFHEQNIALSPLSR